MLFIRYPKSQGLTVRQETNGQASPVGTKEQRPGAMGMEDAKLTPPGVQGRSQP